jgi:hypothetical protein
MRLFELCLCECARALEICCVYSYLEKKQKKATKKRVREERGEKVVGRNELSY